MPIAYRCGLDCCGPMHWIERLSDDEYEYKNSDKQHVAPKFRFSRFLIAVVRNRKVSMAAHVRSV